MLTILTAIAVSTWFALLYPLAARNLATATPPRDAPLPALVAILATFAFMPLVFTVSREDGNAVLEEGLSASNIVLIALTGVMALHLALRAARDPAILRVPFAMPYLPLTLMTGLNGASTLWSVVPAYTAYRAVEFAVFTLATILVFDRRSVTMRGADLLALFVAIWLAAVSPEIVANLASGIVFSAAKNNMMPLVCAALLFLVMFDDRQRRRKRYGALALAGFVVAGSAASTGALVAVVPGMLLASRHRAWRLAGLGATVAAFAGFLLLMLGLSAFPALLDLLSTILQKPAEELAGATGRSTFWPTFIEATRHRVFGSGFSAADRFVQLLMPTTALADDLGREAVFIASAHNMYLSAWAGTGIAGLAFALLTLGTGALWAFRLPPGPRRFALTTLLFLALNGMTTPGIFQDWNPNVLAFVAVLAYARVGVAERAAERAADRPGRSAWGRRPGPALEPGWRGG